MIRCSFTCVADHDQWATYAASNHLHNHVDNMRMISGYSARAVTGCGNCGTTPEMSPSSSTSEIIHNPAILTANQRDNMIYPQYPHPLLLTLTFYNQLEEVQETSYHTRPFSSKRTTHPSGGS